MTAIDDLTRIRHMRDASKEILEFTIGSSQSSFIKHEVFTGVINCADDGFACAISQYESIFESLDRLEE